MLEPWPSNMVYIRLFRDEELVCTLTFQFVLFWLSKTRLLRDAKYYLCLFIIVVLAFFSLPWANWMLSKNITVEIVLVPKDFTLWANHRNGLLSYMKSGVIWIWTCVSLSLFLNRKVPFFAVSSAPFLFMARHASINFLSVWTAVSSLFLPPSLFFCSLHCKGDKAPPFTGENFWGEKSSKYLGLKLY